MNKLKKDWLKIISISLMYIFINVAFAYDRSNWKHWIIKDSCLDTRHYILKTRSLAPVKYKTDKQCHVLQGVWTSWFTNEIIMDSSLLDVDHTIPLGWIASHVYWTPEKKEMYANYTNNNYHLILVEYKLNRKKGAKPPWQWLPPKNKCKYISYWLLIIAEWDVQISDKEIKEFDKLIGEHCGG